MFGVLVLCNSWHGLAGEVLCVSLPHQLGVPEIDLIEGEVWEVGCLHSVGDGLFNYQLGIHLRQGKSGVDVCLCSGVSC